MSKPVRSRTRRRRSTTSLGVLALVTALGLSACSSASPASEPSASANQPTTAASIAAPQAGGTLLWAIETKLQTVNPHRNGQDKAGPILRNVFDSYLYRTAEGTYEPWLADSYEVSTDGLQVTLKLKPGITFSDGAAFNAAAVVANFDKIRTEGYLSSIPGGLRFLDSYEATDDLTVRFTLTKPDVLFLLYLSGTSSSPLSPASLAKPQDVLEAGGAELAGIGPFVIKSFTPNTELSLTKRADFAWAPESIAKGQQAAYLDEVVYRTFPEGATRSGALQQGQVQISSDIQPLDVSLFQDTDDFTYLRTPVGGLPYGYYFNISKPPFDDLRVRQAFVKGFDLDAILQSIYQGSFDRAWAPISVAGPFADTSLQGWSSPDIEQANKLLDEAGWTERNADGIRVKDGQTLTVRVESAAPFVRESRDQVAVAIGAALKQNVGIEYKFEVLDLGTSTDRMNNNDYEIFDNSYGGADPASGLDLLYYASDPSRGFIAYGQYKDADLEALVDTGRFSSGLAARKTAYTELQTLVTKEKYYVLPIYQTQDNLAAIPQVQGITIDQATGQPFGAYTVWLQQ